MPLQDRFEATSDAARRQHPSSAQGEVTLELQVHAEPSLAAATLPELYGIDSFEFLIVDPEYAFVSWEITPATLAAAAQALGPADFAGRALQLRIYASGTAATALSGSQAKAPVPPALAGFNLFGEVGRWFLRAGTPGQTTTVVLGYAAGAQFYELSRRGPVSFPRNTAVDAARYAELHVTYDRGPKGQLILAGLSRPQPQRWPAALPPAAVPPVPLDYLDGQPGWADVPGTSAQQPLRRPTGAGGLSSLTNVAQRRVGDV